MQHSVINKNECAQYDFGHLLFSPDFFMKEKIDNWRSLERQTNESVSDYFLLIDEKVNEIDTKSKCYDLTDGLPKFFDGGEIVDSINSTKKIAVGGDFAISRMRSYLEEMAIVENSDMQQLFSTEFLIFRAKTQQISTHTLFALCMSDYVQTILKHGQYGTEHPRFYDFLLTELPIQKKLLTIDPQISEIIDSALKSRKQSRKIFLQAENLLVGEIGLSDWRPTHKLAFVANYADVKQAERIDADYFQPKYAEIVDAVKNCSKALGSLVSMQKCVEVGSGAYIDEGVPFVRVSNLNPFEITHEKRISEELYSQLREYQPEQGEILFSKDATPGVAHFLRDEPQKMIPSSGLLRLKRKSDDLSGEYLTLVLNSMVVKQQMERDVGGSVILHWRPDQIEKTLIPILPKPKRDEIQRKVCESFELRAQSKRLLENAKRAVEMAIETDEQTALDWLNRQD